MSLRRRSASGLELPSWIFDIEEFDDPLVDNETAILEELEIDISQIHKAIIHMIISPWVAIWHPLRGIFGYSIQRGDYPMTSAMSKDNEEGDIAELKRNISEDSKSPVLNFHHSSHHPLYGDKNQEFWGPCAVVVVYAAILWLGRVSDVPWVFVIWTVGASLSHLVARVSYHSTLALHISVLGYSVIPLLPFAVIISLIKLPEVIAYLLQILGVTWAAAAAFISYKSLLVLKTDKDLNIRSISEKNGIYLLLLPIILTELYMTSLLPI